MNLIPFQSDRKKKQRVLIISICLVLLIAGVVLYRTFALFQESKDYNVIKGSVPDYIDNYDVKVALTIDGVGNNSLPSRDDGKAIESITCDKGAKGYWDYVNWALNVDDLTTTRTRCQVNFVTRYTEPILYGTDPVLKDGMIPVTIDNNGKVYKADIKTEWYNYKDKHEWANAVILYPENERENPGKEYQDGEEIDEDDIESYFVWIPRYRYKLFNKENGNYPEQTTIESNEQIIEIVFEHKDSVRVSEGSKYGEWLTHPAFTSFDVNGIWVGKFETGYKGATTTVGAQQNSSDSTKIQIKPNVYSWRYIQVANAYNASLHYKEEYISHMMKNTEWGAVAYLQHSIYGSHESVRINNNESCITGYGAVNEPMIEYPTYQDYGSTALGASSSITRPWNTDSGRAASTTNNMYGVYDMSGGVWEYVMGVLLDSTNAVTAKPCSGENVTYNSGFKGKYCNVGETGSLTTEGIDFPIDTRYFDIYSYGTSDAGYNRRILGDATGEMGSFQQRIRGGEQRPIGSWYDDESGFIYFIAPWFMRGGHYAIGNGTGVFNFFHYMGNVNIGVSFRVVLAF